MRQHQGRVQLTFCCMLLCLMAGCIRFNPPEPLGPTKVDQLVSSCVDGFCRDMADVFDELAQANLKDAATANVKAKELVRKALADSFEPIADYQGQTIGGDKWDQDEFRAMAGRLSAGFRKARK